MTTLARAVSLSGRGIHSGAESCVRIEPSESCGVKFRTEGGVWPVASARRRQIARNTTLVLPDGTEVMTVEHLLSSLAGMGVDDAVVEISGPEVPILDGSAAPFVRAIEDAGVCGEPRRRGRRVFAPVAIDSGESSIQAIPSGSLRMTYIVDYPNTAIGTVMKSWLVTPEVYAAELAPARTFALLSEVEAMRAAGLAMGGSLDNALVVGPDGPMDGRPLRVEAEYAAHKAMDMLGDLALLGEIPTAHYICIRGGHALHSRLVSRLRSVLR